MGASTADSRVASPPSSPRLRRQRSLVSSMSSRGCNNLCISRNSFSSDAFDDLFQQFPSRIGGFSCLQRAPQKQESAWQESRSRLLGNRRFKMSSRGAYPETDEAEDVAYCKPSPWKLFIRKVRAETKKMNFARPSAPGFHYDPLSYAMNFDGNELQQPMKQFLRYGSSDVRPSSDKIDYLASQDFW